MLFLVDQIGLPLQRQAGPDSLRLNFEFKADADEPVATGHNNGCIVINIKEADSVERERSRVAFGEPQRSLVGHIRHELGHFYWDLFIKNQHEADFIALFGNHLQPTYGEAMQRYYAHGPLDDWQTAFISGYATMHPWEDFAETFGAYLDMCSVVDSARHFGMQSCGLEDFDSMVAAYIEVGVMVNEFNRDMGLLDLVPEVFVKPVVNKLRFIHQLRKTAVKN